MAPTPIAIPEIATILQQIQQQIIQLQHCLQPQQAQATPTTTLDDWLDSSDVLLQLRISKRTLHNLRTKGHIPYTRLGGKLMFKKTDIEQALHNNYVREVQYREKERRQRKKQAAKMG